MSLDYRAVHHRFDGLNLCDLSLHRTGTVVLDSVSHKPRLPVSFNRRFIYHAQHNVLVLGLGIHGDSTHAQEWHASNSTGVFDETVRGWVGCGGGYPQGIIHFAPQVMLDQGIERVDAAYALIDHLMALGLSNNTTLKNFLRFGEHNFVDA